MESLLAQTELPLTPREEVERRLGRFQLALAAADTAAALVTHPISIFYLTGTMQDAWLIVPADGPPTLLVRKSLSRARRESPLTDIQPFPGIRAAAAELDIRRGGGRLGLDLDVVPAATYLKLAGYLPNCRWVNSDAPLRQVRAVKSPWEIERQRRAASLQAVGFEAIKAAMAAGVAEHEVSVAAEAAMRRAGHAGVARFHHYGVSLWFCILESGVSAAYPTAFAGPLGSDGLHPASGMIAGRRRLELHRPLMADILTNYEGYHADIARVFCLGEPPAEVRRAHDFCREALRRIEDLLRPGATGAEIFRQSGEWAKQRGEPVGFMGYGENCVKSFGHGIGLEVDELPVLAQGFTQPLEAGMVIAAEPKAFHPELGPAGLEMTYVITESGPRALLDYPEEIVLI